MAAVLQTGTAQIASGGATSVTITRGVTSGFVTAAPPSRTVLWWTLTGGNNEPRNNYVRAVKTDEDTVTFQRGASASATLDIRWYLLTFGAGEAVVQDVAITRASAATAAAISAPSLGAARFVVPMGCEWNNSGNNSTVDYARYTIDSDTQVSVRTTGDNSRPIVYAAQVVEIAGSTVQVIEESVTASTATTLDYDITAVDRTLTLLIGGCEATTGLTQATANWDMSFLDNDTVRLERNTGTSADFAFTIYAVTFPSGSLVQAATVTSTGQTFNGTLSTAVVQADTCVIASGLSSAVNGLGSGRSATTDIGLPNRNRFRTTTTTTTNAQGVRGGSDSDSQTITLQAFSVVAGTAGPTIDTQPSNATVILSNGAAASFTVAATGTGTLSYQWSVDDGGGYDPISGATSATLNLTGIAIGANGYLYRCAVTDDNGTTDSNAATLSVYNGPRIATAFPATDGSGESVGAIETDFPNALRAGSFIRLRDVSGTRTSRFGDTP